MNPKIRNYEEESREGKQVLLSKAWEGAHGPMAYGLWLLEQNIFFFIRKLSNALDTVYIAMYTVYCILYTNLLPPS